MYRNIVYNSKKQNCIIFSWDENGKPIKYEVPFKPYIYLLSNNKNRIDAYSIFNEPLVKKEFETQSERYRFIQNYEYPRIYHNLDTQQQCLVDLFWNQNETDEFSKNLLNVGFIDIETYSPNGFPNPLEANDEINAVTLYCSYTKKYYVFGCRPFNNKEDDVFYIKCNNERHLLTELVKYINDLQIDVLSAWNGEGFDYPYICNRIARICGEEYVKKLSPAYEDLFNPIRKREVIGDRGEVIQKWTIEGLSLIDYMVIYKKYTYADRPSFALDYIANAELGDQKIEHNGLGLHELADSDWQKFIEYNIQDVRLLVKLDEKLKFINLLKLQSYVGLTTLEKALGTVSVTLGALAIRCKYKNKILHTKTKFDTKIDYAGGYVKEPVAGFCDDVVSYDANSLYPNTIISLNISPETKLGKIVQEDNEFVWFRSNKDSRIIKADKKEFFDKCKKNKIAVSKSNVLFSQTVVGILPEFMDYYYKGRVKTKKILKQTYKQYEQCTDENEKRKLEDRIEYLDLLQLAQKITLNSAYGALGAAFCPINDVDLSSSITLTGQAVVKQAGEIARQFCLKYGADYDPVRYGDTDSVVGDTKIVVNGWSIKIEDYYNQCNGKLIKEDIDNQIFIKEVNKNDSASSYDIFDNKLLLEKHCSNKIKYIKKHKVNKELYKISYKNSEVILTCDHSLIIRRDNEFKVVKPKDIISGDKIIYFYNHIFAVDDFKLESLGIKEEWVYDIEVEDTHNFFANNILVHNSNYLSFHDLFEHLNIKLLNSKGNITDEAWNIIKEYDDYINEKITEYAKEEFNSKDPRFVFKREVIADKGFFITKKRYAVHVVDDEGKKVKKLKFKGIDIVRNTMPEKIKPMAKKWLECMVVERDRMKCNQILKEIFEAFKSMSLEELSFSINCSNIEKYVKPISNKLKETNNVDEFAVQPHCPYHIHAANNYNVILRKEGLDKKYETIKSGDKVKIIYVEANNKYNQDCLAYKNIWPEEFNNIFKIDYNKIYDKIINSMCERFYDIVFWQTFKPSNACHTDLFDFLGE